MSAGWMLHDIHSEWGREQLGEKGGGADRFLPTHGICTILLYSVPQHFTATGAPAVIHSLNVAW